MRILIVSFSKIKYMPYMYFYLDNIDVLNNDVHLLYWNRDEKDEDKSALKNITLHEFMCYQEDDVAKISKLGNFKKYRLFALQVLNDQRYDFIIVLHSLPGVLILDKLKEHYQDKYIFDYRDFTYESFKPFKNIISDLVKGSYATFVSSDAFRRFLPESQCEKMNTSHNILLDSLNHRDEKEKYGTKSNKIRIAFWGFIRHEAINRQIIRKIASDERFELYYYGREQQVALNLKEYVKGIGATNVYFYGEYKSEDRYEFVRNTDIIHNIYYDKNTMLAMGNKYYDGAIFRIPQICMKGSFMAEQATKSNIGLNCDPYCDDFLDRIWDYYSSLDIKSFSNCCDREVERVLNEYYNGIKKIREIFWN